MSTLGIIESTIHHLAHCDGIKCISGLICEEMYGVFNIPHLACHDGVKHISGLICEETCGVLKILENMGHFFSFLFCHLT